MWLFLLLHLLLALVAVCCLFVGAVVVDVVVGYVVVGVGVGVVVVAVGVFCCCGCC